MQGFWSFLLLILRKCLYKVEVVRLEVLRTGHNMNLQLAKKKEYANHNFACVRQKKLLPSLFKMTFSLAILLISHALWTNFIWFSLYFAPFSLTVSTDKNIQFWIKISLFSSEITVLINEAHYWLQKRLLCPFLWFFFIFFCLVLLSNLHIFCFNFLYECFMLYFNLLSFSCSFAQPFCSWQFH